MSICACRLAAPFTGSDIAASPPVWVPAALRPALSRAVRICAVVSAGFAPFENEKNSKPV